MHEKRNETAHWRIIVAFLADFFISFFCFWFYYCRIFWRDHANRFSSYWVTRIDIVWTSDCSLLDWWPSRRNDISADIRRKAVEKYGLVSYPLA